MNWYNIKAVANETEVTIYDEIVGDQSEMGVNAKAFCDELRAIGTPRITLRLNTPGGDVFAGFAIYNTLREHAAYITVKIDGLAASIGSVIAMAGDEVRCASNGFVMIHNASGLVMGTAEDMKAQAAAMEKIDSKIAAAYATKSGKSADEFRTLMRAETWLTAEEAKALGLVDVIDGESQVMPQKVAASLSRYNKVPERFRALTTDSGTAAEVQNMETETKDATTAETPTAAVGQCELPDGTTAEMDEESCKAKGGEWYAPSEEQPMEDVKKDESPAAEAAPVAKTETAATLAELKAAFPKASAEWREQIVIDGLTLLQAKDKWIEHLEAQPTAVETVPVASNTNDDAFTAKVRADWMKNQHTYTAKGFKDFDQYLAAERAIASGLVR